MSNKEPSNTATKEKRSFGSNTASIPSSDASSASFKKRFLRIVDLRLFADPVFILFSTSIFFIGLGYNIPVHFIVDRAVDSGRLPHLHRRDDERRG